MGDATGLLRVLIIGGRFGSVKVRRCGASLRSAPLYVSLGLLSGPLRGSWALVREPLGAPGLGNVFLANRCLFDIIPTQT